MRHMSTKESQGLYCQNLILRYLAMARYLTRCNQCDKMYPECARCRSAGYFCGRYYMQRISVHISTANDHNISLRQCNVLNMGSNENHHHRMANRSDGWGLNSPSTVPEDRAQCLALFLESFIPRNSIQNVLTRQRALSWYEDLPQSLGRSDILDDALSALSLIFIGAVHHDGRLLNKSLTLRNSVVRKINQLKPTQGARINEDLIGVSMVMAQYQVRDSLNLQQ